MKIYTKTGDNLFTTTNKGKVYKSSLIIEIEGTLDEVETTLSLARCKVSDDKVKEILANLTNEMFSFGSDFLGYSTGKITKDSVTNLENTIDLYQEKLEKIDQFVTPSTEASAFIHLARVTVRRLERRIVRYALDNKVEDILLQYVNRLSDLLFTLARWVEKDA